MYSAKFLPFLRSSHVHCSLRPISKNTCRHLRSVAEESDFAEEPVTSLPYQSSFSSFWDMIRTEKSEAKNYLLIEDKCKSIKKQTPKNMSHVLGTAVSEIHKYTIGMRAFTLVKLENYADFVSRTEPCQPYPPFPVRTRMLTLRSFRRSESEDKTHPLMSISKVNPEIEKQLSGKNIEAAIKKVESSCRMSRFGSKLRFFFLNQIEETVCTGALSDFHFLPFGSSVNGFGDDRGDLDMVMVVRDDCDRQQHVVSPYLSYQSKLMMTERFLSQRLVDSVGDYLQFFMPGIVSLTRIPRARVPIVKIYSDITGLDADISFQASAYSVKMAETLFRYSLMDDRLRKLMCFIKIWAKHHSLTNQNPGPWYTNFMLMLMIIHFFQTRQGFRLPPINNLKAVSPNGDNSDEDLSFTSILREFFEFLAYYDYQNKAMSLLSGKSILKPTHAAIHIENPLEADLNVCTNVHHSEVRRLTTAASTSLALMLNSHSVSLSDLCKPTTKTTLVGFNSHQSTKGIIVGEYMTESAE